MPVPTHRPGCETHLWRWNCPDCGSPIWYFSCSCGSKVFFDTRGPDWKYHADICPIYKVRQLIEMGKSPAELREMFYKGSKVQDPATLGKILKYLQLREAATHG